MLVLSRYIGESIRINDDLLVTVAVVGRDFVELAVSSADHSNPKIVTLGVGQKVDIAEQINVVLVMIKDGKVRLGINAPRETQFERSPIID